MQGHSPSPAHQTLASLRTRADVARFLGLTVERLNFLLFRLAPKKRYQTHELRKRSGGKRIIRAPIAPLKGAQRKVANLLAELYAPRSCVNGYVRGRSIVRNAKTHLGKAWVLRVDLKDFFPTINFGRVRGMLLKPPFSVAEEAATTLAQLCCHENELPQGSPASPVISNIICRGLDHVLAGLARAHRCSYSRYCDDLVFSTNRRSFPAALARFEDVAAGEGGTVVLGEALLTAITKAGFHVNAKKVQLRSSSQRQMVTGLVTNERLNVPRDFIRGLRMVLHVWNRRGPAAAAGWYMSTYDTKKNRPAQKAVPAFKWVVRGKVQYLGAIRGWRDPTYVRMARKLAQLDPEFKPTHKPSVRGERRHTLHVYVEGKTDKQHIEAALAALRRKGLFKDLLIKIAGVKDGGGGSSVLMNKCKSYSERTHPLPPCVFVFDSDEDNYVRDASDHGGPKSWGNGVYSLVIPNPAHRSSDARLCIELLYTNGDLTRENADGRRLYLTSEFDPRSQIHRGGGKFTTYSNKKALVVDDGAVFSIDGTRHGLTKAQFADLVTHPSTSADFSGFEPLFDMLDRLHERVEDELAW